MRTKTSIVFFLFGCLFSITTLMAQEKKTVSGVVRDNNGVELAGASIAEKGTNNKVMTNKNGAFTISVAPKATLQISFVGFVTKEVAVGSEKSINIALEAGNNALEEVVVTSLGIGRTQKAL